MYNTHTAVHLSITNCVSVVGELQIAISTTYSSVYI